MTKEEETLKYLSAMSIIDFNKLGFVYGKQTIDEVLNLIKTQQAELETKDKLYKKAIKGLIKANKIINSIADELIKNNIHKKYCYYVAGSTECNHNCRECVKQYYERKIESENRNN